MDLISQQNLSILLGYIVRSTPQREQSVVYYINENFSVRVLYHGKGRWLLYSVVSPQAADRMEFSVPHLSLCVNQEECHRFLFDGKTSMFDVGHSGVNSVSEAIEKFASFFSK